MSGYECVGVRWDRLAVLSVAVVVLLAGCSEKLVTSSPASAVARTDTPLASAPTPVSTATAGVTPVPMIVTPIAPTTAPIAPTASRGLGQFLIYINANLGGTPQIPPRMPITDPAIPTYPPTDVERYVLSHHMTSMTKLTIAEDPAGMLQGVTLTTVMTYNIQHADTPLPLAGDYLVYIAEFRGTYSVAGGAYSPGPRPTYNTAIWVFHAQLGVILAEGIVNR